MNKLLPLLLIPLLGCTPTYEVPSYLSGLSLSAGAARLNAKPRPKPNPAPNEECQTCFGVGWLGDGTHKKDCPDCETPWKQEPLSIKNQNPLEETLPEEVEQPVQTEKGGDLAKLPGPVPKSYVLTDYVEACKLAEEEEIALLVALVDDDEARFPEITALALEYYLSDQNLRGKFAVAVVPANNPFLGKPTALAAFSQQMPCLILYGGVKNTPEGFIPFPEKPVGVYRSPTEFQLAIPNLPIGK